MFYFSGWDYDGCEMFSVNFISQIESFVQILNQNVLLPLSHFDLALSTNMSFIHYVTENNMLRVPQTELPEVH